jgi:flagellar biosynthesis GTPase FlhF
VLDLVGLPALFLTCGQNVPDDILAVNPRQLADLCLRPETLSQLQMTHFDEWIKAARGAPVAGEAVA